jgi:siroheme decarboxylase
LLRTLMDEIDRKILNLIQEEFPVMERPYAEIGRLLGITEDDALSRVAGLKEAGYIRRLGPILERKKLGYVSTLCGVHVDEEELAHVVARINAQTGVTHNYEREGDLNVWFTITKPTQQAIDDFISRLEEDFRLKVHRFPEKRVFKIKTYFPL